MVGHTYIPNTRRLGLVGLELSLVWVTYRDLVLKQTIPQKRDHITWKHDDDTFTSHSLPTVCPGSYQRKKGFLVSRVLRFVLSLAENPWAFELSWPQAGWLVSVWKVFGVVTSEGVMCVEAKALPSSSGISMPGKERTLWSMPQSRHLEVTDTRGTVLLGTSAALLLFISPLCSCL